MTNERRPPESGSIPLSLGAPLQAEHVLGRDALIAGYWARLKTQSIELVGPPRIGKTSILRRMAAYPAEGFSVCLVDLAGCETANSLLWALHNALRSYLGEPEILLPSSHGLLLPTELSESFEKFHAHARVSRCTAVLACDDFHTVISKLLAREGLSGYPSAADVFEALHDARRRNPLVRMVLVGERGYMDNRRWLNQVGSSGLADVFTERVPPLDEAATRNVVSALAPDLPSSVCNAIANRSEGHPQFIQLLVAAALTEPDSETELRHIIESPGDPLGVQLDILQIDQCFVDAERARQILDILAVTPRRTFSELLTDLPDAPTRTQLSAVLRRLVDDFYLDRDGTSYRFCFDFFRQAWMYERGLEIPAHVPAPKTPHIPAAIVPPEHPDADRYLHRLSVTNFKLISDLTLDFHTEAGRPRMWTCLLGDNGCGKTSLLQAVALGAVGEYLAAKLTNDPRTFVDARHPDRTTRVATDFTGGLSTSLEVRPGRHQWAGVGQHDAWLEDLRSHRRPGFFVAGYGVGRRIARPGEVAIPEDPLSDRVRGLFDVHHKCLGVEFGEALAKLGLRGAYVEALAKLIDAAGLDQHRLLPGVSSLESRDGNELVVHFDPGDEQPITLPPASLSAGYQSVLTWISELLGQAMLERGEPVAPADMTGIVLIDEIDLHLHPTWQRRIVPILRALFPRLQFVVTTHSPLVLTGFDADEIVALAIEDGKVVRRPWVPDLAGFSVEDILEDDALFGTDPFGIETRKLIEEHRTLASIDKADRSEAQRERLIELARILGPTDKPHLRNDPVLARLGELEAMLDREQAGK